MKHIEIKLETPEYIYLKSRERGQDGFPIHTGARLLEPIAKGLRNDEELYQLVHKHGMAVVYYLGETTTMAPADFEKKWRGD